MSCVDREADAPPPPLRSEQLARRMLRTVAGDSPRSDRLAMVAADAYSQLRARLTVFLGDQGFDALWRRAIHLTRRAFPAWDDDAAGTETSLTLPPGLYGAVCDSDAAETHTRLLVAFTNFLVLLFTFIGADLGTRLIDTAWPDLPPDTADRPAEGATL